MSNAAVNDEVVPENAAQSWSDTQSMLDDESWLNFETFAQNVLADDFFHYGAVTQTSDPSALPTPSGLATTTPLEASVFASPQTAAAALLTESSNTLEVTPVIERSIQLFMQHGYPTYPLLKRQRLDDIIQHHKQASTAEKTLIWSICAFQLVHVDSWPSLGFEQRSVSARRFIRQCLEARIDRNVESARLEDVLTSLFIGVAYFELKARKAAWFYIRESIALAIGGGFP